MYVYIILTFMTFFIYMSAVRASVDVDERFLFDQELRRYLFNERKELNVIFLNPVSCIVLHNCPINLST